MKKIRIKFMVMVLRLLINIRKDNDNISDCVDAEELIHELKNLKFNTKE